LAERLLWTRRGLDLLAWMLDRWLRQQFKCCYGYGGYSHGEYSES
jgi:hypothetical protein